MSTLTVHKRLDSCTAEPGRRLALWPIQPLLTLLGLSLWVAGLRAVQIEKVSDIGLVGLIPPLSAAGVAAQAWAFAWSITDRRLRPALLAGQVGALVFTLHGMPLLVEPLPRFPTAWLHAGFADHIAATGQTLPLLDARFSWPGFFAGSALITEVMGVGSALALVSWTPIVFNVFFLVPLWLLSEALVDDPRRRWLGLWMFVLVNWVGQDYFSPQATAYLLFLAAIAILLRHLGSQEKPPAFVPMRLCALISKGGSSDSLACAPFVTPSRPAQRAALVVVVAGIAAVLSFTHQLTPFLLMLAVGLLAATRRITPRSLPLLLAVLSLAWVSYGATAYWAGHLDNIFGSIGKLTGTVSANVGERVVGSARHLAVIYIRLGLSAAVWGLAAIGAVRRLRAGRLELTALAMMSAPFVVLALQNYGGEVLLRVYLFTLPGAVALATAVLWPRTRRRPVLDRVMIGLTSAVLAAAFFTARYGNERFEYIERGDLAAVQHVYKHARPGSTLVAMAPNLPWRYQKINVYEHDLLIDNAVPSEHAIHQLMAASPGDAYLIVTKGQEAYLEMTRGFAHGWADQLVVDLLSSGRFRPFYITDTAAVLQLAESGGP